MIGSLNKANLYPSFYRITVLILFLLGLFRLSADAQHEHPEDLSKSKKEKTGVQAHIQDTTQMHDNMKGMHTPMSHAYSLNLPMNRNGSGTGWAPDASPMFGWMFHAPRWSYMLHGNVFVRYNNQDFTEQGSRGDESFDIPTWFMLMGQRKTGEKGLFHFNTMFSLDPILVGGEGYPLLFQTGENYKGKLLVDRQHPHDLFSELSVSYAHAFTKKADLFIYLAYPGEPALGPVAFMHRVSSLDNPNSPLSHHWVDATHITFGVATIGLRAGLFKIETSLFTGREPDDDRFDFDKPRFDSWSGRISMNPSSNWAIQVSHGLINSPEALSPEEDIYKSTASVMYAKEFVNGNELNGTILWGLNSSPDHAKENAFLAEASLRLDRIVFYGRYDFTQKSTEDLTLNEDQFGENSIFNINALTAGLNFDIFRNDQISIAPGAQITFYQADERLDVLYGENPLGIQAYIRIYPTIHGK